MFHKALTKAYICSVLILIACLMPGSSFPTVDVQWVSFDKFVHLVMYVALMWTLAYGFKYQTKYPQLQQMHLFYGLLISCVYGALIELLQWALTPDRAAELWDFVADAVGATLGLVTYAWGERLIRFWNRLFRV